MPALHNGKYIRQCFSQCWHPSGIPRIYPSLEDICGTSFVFRVLKFSLGPPATYALCPHIAINRRTDYYTINYLLHWLCLKTCWYVRVLGSKLWNFHVTCPAYQILEMAILIVQGFVVTLVRIGLLTGARSEWCRFFNRIWFSLSCV